MQLSPPKVVMINTILLKPFKGKILINGMEVKRTNSNIGYIFQRDYLFEWRTKR